MNKRFPIWLLAIAWSCVAWAGVAQAQMAPSFHGTEAFRDFRLAGYEMMDERMTDLDGDGLSDAIVLEQSAEGIGLSAWKATEEGGFKFLSRGKPAPGNSLANLERVALGADKAFLLDVFEDSPDEADHFVKLFLLGKTGVREVFSSSFRKTHSETDAGRPATQIVDLGGVPVGLEMTEQAGKWPKLVVRHDPKRIALTGRGAKNIWFVIGIRERIFEPQDGAYKEVQDRYRDYLSRQKPASVSATSSLPSVTGDWDASNVTDGDLDTGWVEGRPGPGFGQSVTLSYAEPLAVRMLRLVPGCAESEEEWQKYNRVRRYAVEFENGVIINVNREIATELDPRVEAWENFALPGRGFGNQTLIFLYKPIKSRFVKVTIQGIESGSESEEETCISEISAHQAKVDIPPAKKEPE
jgi:hypothetical protein